MKLYSTLSISVIYFNKYNQIIGLVWFLCLMSYQHSWVTYCQNHSCLFCLFGSVLWHINHCRLFHAKSIFIHINSCISDNSVYHKYTVYFYLTHRYNSIRCYHSELKWNWDWRQWRGTPHSPNLQHYWNPTIRLFSVISRTLVGRV